MKKKKSKSIFGDIVFFSVAGLVGSLAGDKKKNKEKYYGTIGA